MKTNIVIITFETHMKEAYLKYDPKLLEILINQHDHIIEIEVCTLVGNITDPHKIPKPEYPF